jgi:hypothetical protein
MSAISKRSDQIAETSLDGEVVIMRVDTGEFLALKDVGAAIWSLIDGSRDRDALVAALTREFEGDPATIADDTDEFLRQLRTHGLIVDE